MHQFQQSSSSSRSHLPVRLPARCYKCGKDGHFVRDCPMSVSGDRQQQHQAIASVQQQQQLRGACLVCKKAFHLSRDCPEGKNLADANSNTMSITSIAVTIDGSLPRNVTSIRSFIDAIHAVEVLRNVQNLWGHECAPRTIQRYLLSMFAKIDRDLVVLAKNATGKKLHMDYCVSSSVAVSNSKLHQSSIYTPKAIVIVANRDRAIQIHTIAKSLALDSKVDVNLIYGGTNIEKQRNQLLQSSQTCSLLIATIGRFLHFVEDETISTKSIEFVVIDRIDDASAADCNLEIDLRTLFENSNFPPREDRKTIILSNCIATNTIDVKDESNNNSNTTMMQVLKFARLFLRANYSVIECKNN